jgi:hypothetical protein
MHNQIAQRRPDVLITFFSSVEDCAVKEILSRPTDMAQ